MPVSVVVTRGASHDLDRTGVDAEVDSSTILHVDVAVITTAAPSLGASETNNLAAGR